MLITFCASVRGQQPALPQSVSLLSLEGVPSARGPSTANTAVYHSVHRQATGGSRGRVPMGNGYQELVEFLKCAAMVPLAREGPVRPLPDLRCFPRS